MAAASSQANKKLSVRNIIIIALFPLLIGALILRTFSLHNHQSPSSRSTAPLNCYRAEILMRVANITEFLPGYLTPQDQPATKTRKDLIDQAFELLNEALKVEPDSSNIICKKIILDSYAKTNLKSDLNRLTLVLDSKKNISQGDKQLAALIRTIYNSEKPLVLSPDTNKIIKDTLGNSWYSDRLLLRIYLVQNQQNKYQVLTEKLKHESLNYLLRLAFLGIAGLLATIAGLIVIIYQIIIGDKNAEKKNDNNSEKRVIPYDWQTVSLVFLGWIFTQILVAYIVSILKHKEILLSANSLVSAWSTFIIYLLSNGPALLYIYFLALKPNFIKLSDGLNLHLKVKSYNPLVLVIIGLLGWLAALPLVLASYLVSAKLFGSNGSSNPIISIVMHAAQANDFSAVLLFYIVLGVVAPICEESLFRGFLYAYLRSKHGIIFSNVISSALFCAAHFDLGAALPLFCLGAIFAYLREKTDSIVPSIIAHGIWNSANFTLILMLFGS